MPEPAEASPILVSTEPQRQNRNQLNRLTSLFVKTVIYSPQLVEYPETAQDGYLYVIPLEGLTEEEE